MYLLPNVTINKTYYNKKKGNWAWTQNFEDKDVEDVITAMRKCRIKLNERYGKTFESLEEDLSIASKGYIEY